MASELVRAEYRSAPGRAVEPLWRRGAAERVCRAANRRAFGDDPPVDPRELFYVVLLPNGTPWGRPRSPPKPSGFLNRTSRHRSWWGRIRPRSRSPGPAGSRRPGPHACRPCRADGELFYSIRRPDRGGRRVDGARRLLSRQKVPAVDDASILTSDSWHPYAVTRHQNIALGLLQCAHPSSDQERSAPPILEQPRKFILLFPPARAW